MNKRCSKCVLPASVPGISFNQEGQCNWCQTGFPKYTIMGEEKLRQILAENRKHARDIDCLVGVSGGSDSSYVLFELVSRFGVRAEAFTYVHGGLNDFALDNAGRICKSLGVKHHLVSLPANIHLNSFKDFFSAWLDSESAVSAALTCVACKHLHLLGTGLAAERKIPMVVWSVCPIETPPFVLAQSGNREAKKRKNMFAMAVDLMKNMTSDKKMCKAFFKYFGTCVFGCLAFRTANNKYLELRYPGVKHLNFFDYCDWKDTQILQKLRTQTCWDVPKSTVVVWHSDCMFTVFKEYMFQKMIGASYTDAFLSNQVRHGLITREEALEKLKQSKTFYAEELVRVLPILGLEHLAGKIDTSCFKI